MFWLQANKWKDPGSLPCPNKLLKIETVFCLLKKIKNKIKLKIKIKCTEKFKQGIKKSYKIVSDVFKKMTISLLHFL